MKYFWSELSKIEKDIGNSKRASVLLDFDGTISPVAPKPGNACITENVRSVLKKINKVFPVVIVTGRPLNVIMKKVKIRHILYVASHGLEWCLNGKTGKKLLQKRVIKKLDQLKAMIQRARVHYPALILESKPFAVTFHYHLMSHKEEKFFKRWLQGFLKFVYAQSLVKVFHDKKTVEIVPRVNWTKGDAAKFALSHLKRRHHVNFMPIYIGDATTDEDAFIALRVNGVTVRVGRNKKSAAKWYLKNQKEVNRFLEWIADLLN